MTTALPNADTPAAFSTRAVGQWRDVISERFVALTPEPVEPEFFRGALQMHERGGLGVSVISGSPQRVRRGPEEIRRSPGPHLFFIHQVAGEGCVQHDGGTLRMRHGDCVLVHPDRPYELGFDQAFR